MPVGLSAPTELAPVAGIRLGIASAGIKKPGRRDVVVMEVAAGATCAAVFTRNAFCAAPVIVAREHLQTGAPRYLLVNTGNANAGTGDAGLRDARRCCAAVAERAGCAAQQVLPFSTGVIGEPLPIAKIEAAVPAALAALRADAWVDAAYGIMTTDTLPKGVSRRMTVQGKTVTITGIAKGAGMIRPDMATMLSFIATDAGLPQSLLQRALADAVNGSFNRITVDGDTSTNDSCVVLATGASGVAIAEPGDDYAAFAAVLTGLCTELAQAIVRDGEGATKFVTVEVAEGRTAQECLDVAYTIAHSPLVKTALFASDPNWGRILAAVGRAGIGDLVLEDVRVYLGDVCIVSNGGRDPSYTEAAGQAVMSREEITIRVLLGRGTAGERVWTTDFSYDYVKINAEYRT